LEPAVFAPVLLALAAALAYWLADRSLPNPDEGAYLTAAAKILDGGVFYRDIDAYPLPGSSYLLALAMSIFGEHLSVARALAGLVFCTTVLGTYAAALALVGPQRAAWCGLSLLALKFWAFPNFTAYLYSDLALAFAVVTLALFVRHSFDGPSWRIAAVGVLVGFATLSKQNTGIYLGLAVGCLLLWPALLRAGPRERARDGVLELAVFAGGFALAVLPGALYFAAEGLLGQLFASGFLRPFTGYLPTSSVSIGPPLAWWQLGELRGATGNPYLPLLYTDMVYRGALPGGQEAQKIVGELFSRTLYLAFIAIFAACGIRWLRALRTGGVVAEDTSNVARRRFFIAAALSLAIAASAFPRADFPHVINVFPAVLLMLFAWGGGRARRADGVIVSVVLLATAVLALRYDALLTERLRLERAELWVRPGDAWVGPLVATVERSVPRGAPFFVYGHEAYYYFLTDRYFPWPFSQLYPGMAGGDDGARLAAILRRGTTPLVVQGVTRWPGMPRLPGYTRLLRETISQGYVDETAAFSAALESASSSPPRWAFRLMRLRANDAP
jgi:hypothetical protein